MTAIAQHTTENNEAWDTFVETSNNGTVFHRMDFLSYHGDRFKTNEHHLTWTKKGKFIAVLPLGIFEQDGQRVAKSPYGASYGGIVTANGLTIAEAKEISDSLQNYLKELKVDILYWVNTPLIYMDQPTNYVDFYLLIAGAERYNADLTSYIHVVEDPLENFTRSATKSYNKAERSGVTVKKTDDIAGFYEILLPNRAKFDAVPTHTLEESKWLMEKLPENIHLFMAYLDGEAIAGSLVFQCNDKVLLDFYWAHKDEFQDVRPINMLVYEMTKWSHQRGLKYFDFGTQSINMEIRDGNSRMKEAFGATGLFRESYKLQLNG